ncbi:MAG: tryptophan-rich sensory protein [Oscillospiraceae bacterium]|nr:tryptophan-rich sensory protein [Oscillospiraceae bacterium]
MRINWKRLIFCLALPLGVGALSALVSGGMDTYGELNQPPLSPPGWVFPVVWTVLYLLMGYASYLVLESGADRAVIRRAWILYGLQLLANFIWSPLFFGAQLYLAALLWLVVLWVLIFLTIRAFSAINERAGDLLIPYILWVTFAAYLNLGVYLLN